MNSFRVLFVVIPLLFGICNATSNTVSRILSGVRDELQKSGADIEAVDGIFERLAEFSVTIEETQELEELSVGLGQELLEQVKSPESKTLLISLLLKKLAKCLGEPSCSTTTTTTTTTTTRCPTTRTKWPPHDPQESPSDPSESDDFVDYEFED